jgi:hypothetical protein
LFASPLLLSPFARFLFAGLDDIPVPFPLPLILFLEITTSADGPNASVYDVTRSVICISSVGIVAEASGDLDRCDGSEMETEWDFFSPPNANWRVIRLLSFCVVELTLTCSSFEGTELRIII